MIQFLQDRYFLYERVQKGIDVHPSDAEIEEFQKLAKQLNPNINTAVKGCQSCVNDLVKLVFDKQDTIIKRAKFPSQKQVSDGTEKGNA